MKPGKHIFRILSFFMLFCVFTTQVSAWTVQENCVTCEEQDTEDSRPVFKQLTHETVVPHYDFSFGEIHKFFQENLVFFFSEGPSCGVPRISVPLNSYMAKLLEHHIAINAP